MDSSLILVIILILLLFFSGLPSKKTENFISESLVDQTLEKIQQSETKELDGDEQPHIISESYYNYNH